jgi:hypothetical protein
MLVPEAAHLLRLWVRIPPGAWTSVHCECCVLSGTGLCDELITRPEESYRLWCIVVCDLETSRVSRPWPAGGLSRHIKTTTLHYSTISRKSSCERLHTADMAHAIYLSEKEYTA